MPGPAAGPTIIQGTWAPDGEPAAQTMRSRRESTKRQREKREERGRDRASKFSTVTGLRGKQGRRRQARQHWGAAAALASAHSKLWRL